MTTRITRRPIDAAAVLASVADRSAGGTVLFVGTVRDVSEGKKVRSLEYQVYREMAEKRMRTIEKEVKERWPVRRLAMVHREGRLRVGEVSVAVAVSCEHRAEAFEACRYAIDRIKTSLPLWKKEFAKDGASWVSGVPIED